MHKVSGIKLSQDEIYVLDIAGGAGRDAANTVNTYTGTNINMHTSARIFGNSRSL